MADFSFSFDSDNPFAEPEQTPKKADASPGETPPEAPASAANAGDGAPAFAVPVASDDDAFSLDSLDFAFDEDASINDSLPTQTTPAGETAPRQLTPGEAAFSEFDFNAPADVEADVETPAVEAPKVEMPAIGSSVSEETATPEFAAPEFEEVEAPEFTAPEVETPVSDGLELKTPDFTASETTATGSAEPNFAAPEPEALEPEAPVVELEAPELAEPEFVASQTETPQFDVSSDEIEIIEPETSEIEASELSASPTEFSRDEAPEIELPNAKIPLAEGVHAEAEPAEDSESSARSDLEEFNAFTYDFGMPEDESPESEDDETSESEVDLETSVGSAKLEIASEETSLDEPSLGAEEAPTQEAEVAAAPRRIATDSAAKDAPVPGSTREEASEEVASEGQTEGEFRRLRTKTTLKVAVLGASGIGKNHARWFHRHGCEIVGFLGTSPDSTTQTDADLSADFDFEGNAYSDLEVLLQSEKPDVVCVATPSPLHFAHVLQSLEAGAHVLCEKPLVYAPTRKFRENRDGAKELVKVAARRKLNLGTQLQYGGATPILCKLAGLKPADVGDFAMELETANPNSPRDPRELWIDLGPHPVSVAQMLAGAGAQLAEDSIRFEPYQDDDKTEVMARFGINCADGRLLMVRAVVRSLRGENPRKPRRRFSFNGQAVTYAPLQSAKNGFQAQFVAPDGYASVYPDPVDYLIGDFVSACRNGEAPMISGDFGRENLEWMLKVGMPAETR